MQTRNSEVQTHSMKSSEIEAVIKPLNKHGAENYRYTCYFSLVTFVWVVMVAGLTERDMHENGSNNAQQLPSFRARVHWRPFNFASHQLSRTAGWLPGWLDGLGHGCVGAARVGLTASRCPTTIVPASNTTALLHRCLHQRCFQHCLHSCQHDCPQHHFAKVSYVLILHVLLFFFPFSLPFIVSFYSLSSPFLFPPLQPSLSQFHTQVAPTKIVLFSPLHFLYNFIFLADITLSCSISCCSYTTATTSVPSHHSFITLLTLASLPASSSVPS